MRHKHRRWLFVWAMIHSVIGILQSEFVKTASSRHSAENATVKLQERSIFAPRMDYEQWTPIGRGDPLKMDPTYDYVPPVLDHVHYWLDSQSRLDSKGNPQGTSVKESSPHMGKTEILLLGITSKKPSIPIGAAESPYVKYMDNSPPKYQQNHYQRERIHFPYSQYFPTASQGYYKPKSDRLNQKPYQLIPYTILMPPPLPTTDPQVPRTTTSSTREPPVTIQQSNLVYHSSTYENLIPEANLKDNYHTADSMVEAVTWRTPLVPTQVYKIGKVENAHMDAHNTYVNIGKPEVHLQSEASFPSPPASSFVSLQKKEVTYRTRNNVEPSTISIPRTTMSTTPSSLLSTTTQTPSLTTDPLFKHYKQPAEPLRGPMYLIIQGHSKVKTYGPAKQLFGINVQEMNEIPNFEEKFKEFQVKHLHTYKKKEEYMPHRNGRAKHLDNLAQIAQTGYGALEDVAMDNEGSSRRNDGDFQETDLWSGFEVGSAEGEDSVHVYHKGIVDDGVSELDSATKNTNVVNN